MLMLFGDNVINLIYKIGSEEPQNLINICNYIKITQGKPITPISRDQNVNL